MKNIILKLKHHRADFLLMRHEKNDNNESHISDHYSGKGPINGIKH